MGIYIGQQPEVPRNSAESFILRLSEPVLKTGKNITVYEPTGHSRIMKENIIVRRNYHKKKTVGKFSPL